MNLLQSIILGVVEGATEYLPISSTFHLIWTSKILSITQSDFQKAYEVIIQGGAILAVLVLYWQTLISNKKLLFTLLYSFVPTALIGLILYKVIKGSFFENYILQVIIFVLVGIFFLFFEKINTSQRLKKLLSDLTYKDAVIIGLFQALAVFPGVSRAGAVIVGMILLGVKRDEAAKYSFLLAVPTLLAASALDFYKSYPTIVAQQANIGLLIAGFISAFISALFFVRWFIGYLQKHSLAIFGIYRITLALLLFFYFIR